MLSPGSKKFETLVTWLASRQTGELGEEEDDEEEEDENEDEDNANDTELTEAGSLDERLAALPALPALTCDSIACAGFNGRYNKFADTCYSFWNGATLLVGKSLEVRLRIPF